MAVLFSMSISGSPPRTSDIVHTEGEVDGRHAAHADLPLDAVAAVERRAEALGDLGAALVAHDAVTRCWGRGGAAS